MSGRLRTSGLLAAGIVLLAAATGCGGGGRLSKEQYEQKVQTLYAGVQDAFRATDVESSVLLAARVSAAQQRLRDVAEQLEHARPPAEVEHENDEIAEGLRDYAERLDPVREAARRGDRAAIDAFDGTLRTSEPIEQIAEAAEEMKNRGYDLGPIADE